MAFRYKILFAVTVVLIAALIGRMEYHRAKAPATYRPGYTPAKGASSGPCIGFQQAASHAGENGCITGYVLRAFTSKAGNTFLDFCPDYRNCPFSTVIFASDRPKFGNLEALAGRQVEIRGFISTYQGKAEIIVHDPWQIQGAP